MSNNDLFELTEGYRSTDAKRHGVGELEYIRTNMVMEASVLKALKMASAKSERSLKDITTEAVTRWLVANEPDVVQLLNVHGGE